jgi:hypothetical protein
MQPSHPQAQNGEFFFQTFAALVPLLFKILAVPFGKELFTTKARPPYPSHSCSILLLTAFS